MINVVVAYDDNDDDLGHYFEDSFNDINSHFSQIGGNSLNAIRGLDISEEFINQTIIPLNEKSFVFIGLSHGNEGQLLTTDSVYVSNSNVNHFTKSFFYSTACLTGVELGQQLINNGCLCFVGCKSSSLATYEDHYPIYIQCENYCIKEFFNSDKTLEETFNEMMTNFDNHINNFFDSNEILVAMELQQNKDCMVIYGNKLLKKSDLAI